MIDRVKSPLNYTGNKYKILPQMQEYFPKRIKTMVDLFCGGATVGLNTECEKIIFIDNNERVISLLKYLSLCNYDDLYGMISLVIKKYGLSFSAENSFAFYKNQIEESNYNNGLKKYNAEGYYKLRADYNMIENKNSDYANVLLYVLMVYAFNNDMRFSRSGNFNLPVGKTDMNKNNLNRLKSYIERTSSIECDFICADFKNKKVSEILLSADFIYMDPPYLITNAVYNQMSKWDEKSEYNLLQMLSFLLDNNKQFILSNIIEKKGQRNEPLYRWMDENINRIEIVDVVSDYRSASYNKKVRDSSEREVIIKSKVKND